MKKFLIILSVLLILLIFAAAGGLYGAYRVSQLDTNYPKLTLDGLEVGGLTKTETVDLLNASGWDARTATPLTVTTLAGQSFTVDPLRSGLVVPAEGVADWVFLTAAKGTFLRISSNTSNAVFVRPSLFFPRRMPIMSISAR